MYHHFNENFCDEEFERAEYQKKNVVQFESLILEKFLRNLTAEESQLLQKFLRQRITFESNNKHGLTRKFLTRFCKIFAMNSKGWNPWEESSKGKHRSAMNSKV